MDIKRRTFIQAASVGAAGIIAPRVLGDSVDGGPHDATAAQQSAQQKPNMLEMKIWGSCLYVFSKDGKQLELAFFGGSTASTCHTLTHRPQLVIDNGEVREKTGEVDVDEDTGIWRLPPGEIRISTSSLETQPPLRAPLGDQATACPLKPKASEDFKYSLASLAYVPRLRAQSGSLNGWRKRATTRIVLTSGELTAVAPHKVPGDIADMELIGPASHTTNQIVTDTTMYSLPMRSRAVTFSFDNENGSKGSITIEAIVDEPLRLVIQAGPESTGTEAALTAGTRLPHWCALYSAFDKMPAEADRAELRIKKFCFPDEERKTIRTTRAARVSRSARSRAARDTMMARSVSGPTPGDLCPGAIIVLDGATE